ncbi:hypothetical protein BDV36DRAFT_150470 [Aspergillus pseudocaelatus]|uniref:Fatty acid hydroxylase domain-containing protein n=1 Tax=Aspergillus pseudocaelatus TaxID=1825620 RepID=A0ABQ6WP16_9EURO|nr:hypothetical protein BDV36DRAFT_150470 [Aspergillus pseudocaelatus]
MGRLHIRLGAVMYRLFEQLGGDFPRRRRWQNLEDHLFVILPHLCPCYLPIVLPVFANMDILRLSSSLPAAFIPRIWGVFARTLYAFSVLAHWRAWQFDNRSGRDFLLSEDLN